MSRVIHTFITQVGNTCPMSVAAVVRASTILKQLGFSVLERSVIVALGQMGTASASDISSKTGAHRASVYPTLERLRAKGLVVLESGRPRRYRLVPLEQLEEMLSERVQALVEALETLQRETSVSPQAEGLVITLHGRSRSAAQLVRMVSVAQSMVYMVCHGLGALGEDVLASLQRAAERGVTVRVVTTGSSGERVHRRVEQRHTSSVPGLSLVVDEKQALFGEADLSVCGWTENTALVSQLGMLSRYVWDNAKKSSRWRPGGS